MNDNPELISIKECVRLTSLSRQTINDRRMAGTFPKAVSLGDKRIAFVRREVISWIEQRIASRHAEAA